MKSELSILRKIYQNKKSSITGMSIDQWLVLDQIFGGATSHQVYVFDTDEKAEFFYNKFKKGQDCILFTGINDNAYNGAVLSTNDQNIRFKALSKVYNTKKILTLFTSFKSLHMHVPNHDFFIQNSLTLNVEDIISPQELAKKLVSIGYSANPTVEEPGTFSIKGEIFDIYPINSLPIRLQYFDELIETVSLIDKETLRTLKGESLRQVLISPTPLSLSNKDSQKLFIDKIPKFGPKFKNKQKTKELILESLSHNNLFQNFELFTPLFLSNTITLHDVLHSKNFFFTYFDYDKSVDIFDEFIRSIKDSYDQSLLDEVGDDIYPNPADIFSLNPLELKNFATINEIDLYFGFEEELSLEKSHIKILPLNLREEERKNLNLFKEKINKKRDDGFEVYFCFESDDNLLKFNNLFQDSLLSEEFLINTYLDKGFIYEAEKLIFISESDIFTKKIKKVKKSSFSEDIFAEQLASLEIDDYVIHKELGVGQYKGIEKIEIADKKNDYIVLYYEGEDKVYVPVYKLDLIQKHSSSQSVVKLASLKSKKFDQEKSKARKSVKKLAFNLLDLQAKRELKKGFKFSEPGKLFYEFVSKFPFEDTPDQVLATEDIISDMCSERPMDGLVCGDVGYGKTEVAMRAAFKAIEDNKQVAILVPTTVLAFQHYNSFLKRFKDFPINIDYLSRFKSSKETKDILERLSSGTVDIIIGTHKILSSKIKYKDIGLLIIDEEQRFGVSHKEKIKLIKENVDCLTLTATPIPRTLQLSFLGIKDLSLIKTPPLKRQSVKSYLIKEESKTIKNALEKEISRGGQAFVVHNKVQDIEEYTQKISKLCPSAKIIYAHGQLNEKDLEKRITDFYNHKYDILVSTTIIESGIDIPTANTMIVDRADTYGLSQLHQLRGRIGRSEKKAYAYFVIPNRRNISSVASKRLKALQTYADMGAGFSLATSDLEIRGSGDILGAEQSGHIGNIGLELYMDLLKEAISEIKNEKIETTRNIEIQTPFNSYIDESYISESSLRLKYYKKISSTKSNNKLLEYKEEITDIYGPPPIEVINLFSILHARNNFNNIPVDNVKVLSKQIVLNFNKEELDNSKAIRDRIISFFMERPKVYKIKPNYSVICHFKETVNIDILLDFSNYIAMQIEPC